MTIHSLRSYLAHRPTVLAIIIALLPAMNDTAQARILIGVQSNSSSSSSSGAAPTTGLNTQTATAATAAAAQAAQAAVISKRAQDSLVSSTRAFQNAMSAQALANQNSTANLLDSNNNPINGLAAGGLVPVGGVPATTSSSAIQVVDLSGSGKNQLVLSNGGSVTLPAGTAGNDSVTISGAGSVTTTGGSVTTSGGSVTTTTGGTLTANNGGTISFTAGSGTLSASTAATITSSLAGTVTLPSGGGTEALTANVAMTVPAGSTVSFTGSGTATVAVSGAGTVKLSGAGTLASGTGGTITTSSGTTNFTNATISSEPLGTTISLNGSGAISFTGSGSDVLPVIVQPTTATSTPPAFSTTGSVLTTTGYAVPSSTTAGQFSWTGVGALSESVNGSTGQVTDTITQDASQALLYWSSFNIGKNTILDFDQSAGGASAGDWVAFNRILSPSIAPSQIYGQIEAPGQVYVINQNGIVFNGSAQVNTHALVASALPINNDLVTSGLLNNPNGEYLFGYNTSGNITVVSSSANSNIVILSSSAMPDGFGVGSTLLGSTVVSISGNTVTLAGNATAAVGQSEQYTSTGSGGSAGNVTIAASNTSSPTVTLGSGTLPAGFGVGSTLLGSTVQSISGTTVTLASNANTTISAPNQSESYSDNVSVASSDTGSTAVTLASPVLPPGFGVGSNLLGSTVQSINGATVTLAADANQSVSGSPQAASYSGVVNGAIDVMNGAILSSPGSPEGVGGKIALIAPTVDNQGELSSPDGQVILAAGQQVGFLAHPSADPSLRGLDVAVGQAVGNESVTNDTNGFIYAPEADVTMTGPTVNQFGTIESLTSVSLNGRIDLLGVSNLLPELNSSTQTNIFVAVAGTTTAGTVDLGPNSLTEILPDYSSTDTQVGTALALPSQVYIEGGTFHMETGSQLIAPSATATLSLGILSSAIPLTSAEAANIASTQGETGPLPENTGPTDNPVALNTPSQVILDSGANLDVSGSSGVQASVTENIVTAQLTQAILENSPLQETGPLRGAKIQVDVSLTGTNADGSTWYGSPIGDLSGYANLVEHNVGELTVAGGLVTINTNGTVQTSPTSSINVSGGSIDYQGAEVQTSMVTTAEGQTLNISQAAPNLAYEGLASGFNTSSAKWGTSQTDSAALRSGSYYDASFVAGGSGGSLTINASAATLQGALYGNTTVGARQQLTPPTSSTFNLTILPEIAGNNPDPVNIVIQPASDPQTSLSNTIYLSPELFGLDGFGDATLNTGSGMITVASDAVISTAAGDSLTLTAANVTVNGQIYVPSGMVNITALSQDPLDYLTNTTPYDPIIGNIVIASGAVVDTTGLTFDETSDIAPGALPFSVNGGTIIMNGAVTTLEGAGATEPASVVDASGGAARNIAGKIFSGKGGTINLTGLYDRSALGTAQGALVLSGSLSAYGIGQGGTLTLSAPAVLVGSGSAQAFPTEGAGDSPSVLALASGFFSQGGFSNFSVTGQDGVQILSSVSPVLTEETAGGNGSQLQTSLISSSQLPQYPAAPVNLTFSAPGASSYLTPVTMTLDAGASITTGPTGSVSLSGQLVDILGDITAPGGAINITGVSSTGLGAPAGVFTPPDVSVYLGSQSILSTTGLEITTPTSFGSKIYNTGEVLNGGSITIKGNIVGDTGSSLVANGTVGQLDVPVDNTGVGLQLSAFQRSLSPYVNETVASNGGSITLNGIEELYYGGTVSAAPGNQSAIGGTLTVQSGLAAGIVIPTTEGFPGYPELFISQGGTFSPGSVTLGNPLSGLRVGSSFLGSTIQSINGLVVTLSGNANVTASNQYESYSDTVTGNITVANSNSNSNNVTLASAALPSGFGVGSTLLGSTVQSINGTSVTLAANANVTTSNQLTPYMGIGGTGNVTVASSDTSSSTVILASAPSGPSQNGGGYFTVQQFNAGQFGSLILNGNVEFTGNNVTINAGQEVKIVPDSQNGTVFADPATNPAITISAPYIAIGATTLNVDGQSVSNFAPDYASITTSAGNLPASPTPGLATPTYGTASLTLNATDLIDVGFLSLQNIGTTSFSVPTGDIRGGGLFYAAGDVTLTAGQVYTPTAATFTVAAFNALTSTGAPVLDSNGNPIVGTVDIEPGVDRPLPLSAGGTINIYATDIDQEGVIVAPFGTINLGALPDPTTGLTPVLPSVDFSFNANSDKNIGTAVLNQYAPSTQKLILGQNSVTSVSGVPSGKVTVVSSSTTSDVVTLASGAMPSGFGVGSTLLGSTVTSINGSVVTLASDANATIANQSAVFSDPSQALELPYGTIENGSLWIAPNGADITSGGAPVKEINLEGNSINDMTGSLVDLAGGGNLFAYQFSPGLGGTNDILNIYKYSDGSVVKTSAGVSVSSTSFAILPDYGFDYAPIDLTIDSNGVFPYANSSITTQTGNQIYLAGGDGLAAGTYTILPARYALLPGAYLVTPTSGATPTDTVLNPDNSLEMAGYLYNSLNTSRQIVPNITGFEVDSSTVVNSRAEYDISTANSFFTTNASTNGTTLPPLPMDAGQLVFSASQSLSLQQGALVEGNAAPGTDGLGSQVDIASADNIEINSTGSDPSFDGLVLNATALSDIDANSLLIGGSRQSTSSGVVVTVSTDDLVVDNSTNAPLQAGDVILVSNGALTVSADSVITSTGAATAQNLSIVNGGTGAVLVNSSSTSNNAVTLASSTLPSAFGVGSTLLGSTVLSIVDNINGTATVNLAGNANATITSAKSETYAGNVVTVSSSSTTSPTVTLGSATVPVDFGVGSALLGSTVQSINGTTVTLAADANANISSSSYESFSSSDGSLLRLSGDTSATTTRSGGVNLNDAAPSISVVAGATIAGNSMIVDSTGRAVLSASPVVNAAFINASRISIELDDTETLQPKPGLILSASTLNSLQTNAQSLALSSYSSIDFYGSGTIGGAANAAGQYPVGSLTLDAAAIRGFTTVSGANAGGGTVTINAGKVTLGDTINGSSPGAVSGLTPAGSFTINANTVYLGPNALATLGYTSTDLKASDEIIVSGIGSFSAQGELDLTTSMVTASAPVNTTTGSATAANFAFNAEGGALDLAQPTAPGAATVAGGLGATISFTGSSVNLGTTVSAPSGIIDVTATTGNVEVQSGGILDVSGQSVTFGSTTEYTNGGQVNLTSTGLTSTGGNVTLDAGSLVNVSAQPGGGNAGTLTVSAPNGMLSFASTGLMGQVAIGSSNTGSSSVTLTSATLPEGFVVGSSFLGSTVTSIDGTSVTLAGDANVSASNQTEEFSDTNLLGSAGTSGTAGVFNATLGQAVTLSGLTTPLTAGGFTSMSFDVLNGSVTVDGAVGAPGLYEGISSFSLTAEKGGITVDNTINASGITGGTIDLYAEGDVTLNGSQATGGVAMLTVEGEQFNSAGQGGSVDIETRGAGTNGINIEAGSSINMAVDYLPVLLPEAASNETGNSITLSQAGSFVLPSGTPGNDALAMNSGGTITAPGGTSTPFSAGQTLSGLAAGSTVTLSNAGTITFIAGGTGGTVPVWLSSSANFTSSGATNASGSAALTASYAGYSAGTLHLRAPTISNNSDVMIQPIDGTITGESSVVIEGYDVYTPAGGAITSSLEGSSTTSTANDGTIYGNAEGFANNTDSILSRLLGVTTTQAAELSMLYQVTPGAEIINPTGNLTVASTWDLSSFRFGPNGVAGDLTLRAANNLVFSGSLNDGFATLNAPLVSSNVTVNSATVGVINTLGLSAGEVLTGTGIPAGDTITAVLNTPNSSVSFSAGTKTILLGSVTGIQKGEILVGAGIPVGDFITTISGKTVTLNVATTAAESGETVTAEGVRLATKATATGSNELLSIPAYTWNLQAGPSWSYRLVAGAQFTSGGASTANYGTVQSLAELGLNTSSLTNASVQAGSLLLGQNIPVGSNPGVTTAALAGTYAQFIRTGSGNITIDTGGSVDFLNQLASIYTAGSLAQALPGFNSPTGTSDASFETSVYSINLSPAPQYTAQYTESGGNVSINAQQDIVHLTQDSSGNLVLDTSWQFPTDWLYRRGATSATDVFGTTVLNTSELATTTWWINFSNFFEGVGALGGGNVTLNAGGNIVNVDAAVPTNARMPYADASGNSLADSASNLVELGGGNLSVVAGGSIEGGAYYVEQGTGVISANTITSTGDTARISAYDISRNSTSSTFPLVPLPLTLFVGDSTFTVTATNDLTIGSTVNPFWLPQGIGNGFDDESIFSTYGPNSSVSLSTLLGTIDIQGSETASAASPLPGSLYDAYLSAASPSLQSVSSFTTELSLNGTPWTLTLDPSGNGTGSVDNVTNYSTFYTLSPPIFDATAFSGNIQYLSDQILAPSSQGTLRLSAAGSVEGAFNSSAVGNGLTASITILDDNPGDLPSVVNPFGLSASSGNPPGNPSIGSSISQVFALFGESPGYANLSFPTLESFHTPGLLHDNTTTPPVEIDTLNGNIEDFTLISPEKVDISSGLDLQDVSFYIQNNNANDISVVSADRDITLFDYQSAELYSLVGNADSNYVAYGDLQISGPGTLEVLAGRNLALGEGTSPNNAVGTGLGITSIGNSRNPYLPFDGANIIAAAGLGDSSGLDNSVLTFGNVNYANGTVSADNPIGYNSSFIGEFLDPNSGAESAIYLPDLGTLLNLPASEANQQIWADFSQESKQQQDALATTLFYDVLRDSGRDHNNGSSPYAGTYTEGYAAIASLFPSTQTYHGDIDLTSKEIKTTNIGDIDLLLPGGSLNVGTNNLGAQAIDQGILTVSGGNISIFANNDVNIGTSRIFTLHGGNIIMWSTVGNIDAGASSRTVQSAPPTRVLVDSQSANVQTDLAGLATGGGIGVLETVIGAPPGNVDLIAPVGTVNAGDAGIRSSGNINVAAAQVLNAGNIQAGGSSTGVPAPAAAPNISGSVAASSAAGASQNAATEAARQQQPNNQSQEEEPPSIITIEVLGYGGGDDGVGTDFGPDRDSSKATYVVSRP